jgi:hypothetical protein
VQLYISATSNVVSTAIIVERGGGVRDKMQGTTSSLLHQQTVERLQDLVFSQYEACLHITNHIQQAIPLLSGALD